MKFLLSISFASCLMMETFAQITLDSSDFPVPGLSLTRYYAAAEDLVIDNMGGPGTGQEYNFSNVWILPNWITQAYLGTTNPDTINYLDPSTTPFASEHIGASVALHFPPGDDGEQYYYYSSDGNAYWKSGITMIGDFGTGIDTIHANYLPFNVDTILSNQYTFGYFETESSFINIVLNAFANIKSYTFRIITVDGLGTLNTPYGFFDDALRIKYVELKYDSVFVSGNYEPAYSTFDTLYYYHYYTKDVRHPVVIAHTNMFDTIQYMEIINVPPVIYGCTDTTATNYNPLANQDDNSCIYCNTINYTITPDTGICAGNSIILTISGGTTHLWSTGETTNSIAVNPDSTTVYSIYLSDTSACWELATVKVTVHKNVQASLWVDLNTLSDSVLFVNTSTGATNYFWDFDDTQNGTSTEENPKHLYSIAGTKNVMLIASNPCSVDTFYTTIIATGIDENPTGFRNLSGLKIYPNPGKDNPHISFHLNDNATVELSVIDLYGRKHVIISKTEMTSGAHKFYIVSNDLASGIYIVQLNIDGFNHQQKWVKLR